MHRPTSSVRGYWLVDPASFKQEAEPADDRADIEAELVVDEPPDVHVVPSHSGLGHPDDALAVLELLEAVDDRALEIADEDLLGLVAPVLGNAEQVLPFASNEAELGAEDLAREAGRGSSCRRRAAAA